MNKKKEGDFQHQLHIKGKFRNVIQKRKVSNMSASPEMKLQTVLQKLSAMGFHTTDNDYKNVMNNIKDMFPVRK